MSTTPMSIRGINVCESLARHTPEQVERLLERMRQWRMNTLVVHPEYGYRGFERLIRRRCRELGLTLVHYVYTSLAFLPGCPSLCFAKDEQGRPRTPQLACETRLCVHDAQGLRRFREGARRYYAQQVQDGDQVLLATADGALLCQCAACRKLNAVEQWQPLLEIAVDEARRGRRLTLHFISYVRRFSLPRDMAVFSEIDAVMFDLHLRWRWAALGQDHPLSKVEEMEAAADPRAARAPINRYLLDRLTEWRSAFKGQLYVFENLMMQSTMSCPQPNTGALLQDIATFRKLGVDGVVYEAFEPGIDSFAEQLGTLSRALQGEAVEHVPDALEQAGVGDADIQHRAWPYLMAREYDGLALLARHLPDPVVLEHARRLRQYMHERTLANWQQVAGYAMEHRDRLDWLYIAFTLMKWLPAEHKPQVSDPACQRYLTVTKLWDFMEEQERPIPATEAVMRQLLALA